MAIFAAGDSAICSAVAVELSGKVSSMQLFVPRPMISDKATAAVIFVMLIILFIVFIVSWFMRGQNCKLRPAE